MNVLNVTDLSPLKVVKMGKTKNNRLNRISKVEKNLHSLHSFIPVVINIKFYNLQKYSIQIINMKLISKYRIVIASKDRRHKAVKFERVYPGSRHHICNAFFKNSPIDLVKYCLWQVWVLVCRYLWCHCFYYSVCLKVFLFSWRQ